MRVLSCCEQFFWQNLNNFGDVTLKLPYFFVNCLGMLRVCIYLFRFFDILAELIDLNWFLVRFVLYSWEYWTWNLLIASAQQSLLVLVFWNLLMKKISKSFFTKFLNFFWTFFKFILILDTTSHFELQIVWESAEVDVYFGAGGCCGR